MCSESTVWSASLDINLHLLRVWERSHPSVWCTLPYTSHWRGGWGKDGFEPWSPLTVFPFQVSGREGSLFRVKWTRGKLERGTELEDYGWRHNGVCPMGSSWESLARKPAPRLGLSKSPCACKPTGPGVESLDSCPFPITCPEAVPYWKPEKYGALTLLPDVTWSGQSAEEVSPPVTYNSLTLLMKHKMSAFQQLLWIG